MKVIAWGLGFILALVAGLTLITLYLPKGTWWGQPLCFVGGIMVSCFFLSGFIRALKREGKKHAG